MILFDLRNEKIENTFMNFKIMDHEFFFKRALKKKKNDCLET